jgi:hypothetical protein
MSTIIKAKQNDNLAIFIGAGVSQSSNNQMPSWGTLIDNIKREIDENNETDYLKIAQYFHNSVGTEKYFSTLENLFPQSPLPSFVHKRIFDINPHIIITTNWDSILECANEEYIKFYDIVCNDKELAQSIFPRKIIKMHGDFLHRNIVFTEEDYLNYENNFPLITNYIKNILSTHVVLFFGYSYNDVSLKLIIQWLRNNVKDRPAMFLTEFASNSNRIEYLGKQGIQTIILSNINNKLDGIDTMDRYSKMTYTFLDNIYKGYDLTALRNTDSIVQFVYKKVESLDSLNGILLGQIQKILTNCGFIFDEDSSAILQFYGRVLTGDYNHEIRDIYTRFIDALKPIVNGEKPLPVMLVLFSIFIKAGIKGIMLGDESLEEKTYISFQMILNQEIDICNMSCYDFAFHDYVLDSNDVDELFESAFKLYNLNRIEDAYNVMGRAIDRIGSANGHVKLFIALFNRNILLKKLKFKPEYDDKYTNVEEYDIESCYNNLTNQLKLAVDPIYRFINFFDIYKYSYSSISDLDKIRKNKRAIDSGGFVFSDNIHQFSGQHINLINFVHSNTIMIEDISEFKKINHNFIEIALLRQTQNNKTVLVKFQVYSCIKYLNLDELEVLFQDYYKKDSKKIGTFELDDADEDWLINIVLKNCVDQYSSTDNMFYNPSRTYMENLLFILSITPLSDIYTKTVISLIEKLISQKSSDINLFKSMDLFLGLQYRIYKTPIEKQSFISFIETLINNIIEKRINRYEFIVYRNYLSNLYGYASIVGAIFENTDIVDKLLESLSEYDLDYKQNLIQDFILNIYPISNDIIKNTIKNYVLSFMNNGGTAIRNDVIFNNTLVILNIKEFTNSNIDEIKTVVESYTKSGHFSSILHELKGQIDYMITTMNINGLEDISVQIDEVIKKHQERQMRSIF